MASDNWIDWANNKDIDRLLPIRYILALESFSPELLIATFCLNDTESILFFVFVYFSSQ